MAGNPADLAGVIRRMKLFVIALATIALACACGLLWYRVEYGTWELAATPATLWYNGLNFHESDEVLTWDQLVANEHRAEVFSRVPVVRKAQTIWGQPIFALDLPQGQGPDGGMCIGLKVGSNQYREYMATVG